MPRSANPDRLWLFAVEDDAVQLTWSTFGAGPVRVRATGHGFDAEVDVRTDGGPGAIVLDGLPPATTLDLVVTGAEVARAKRFTTLAPPPGPELFRFATISDSHLGERRFGYRGTIVETDPPPGDEGYTYRATRAALRELSDWGAQLVVVKGDVTATSRMRQWDQFAKLIAEAGLPVEVIAGNHDSGLEPHPNWILSRLRSQRSNLPEIDEGERVTASQAFTRLGLRTVEPIRFVDVPGLRIVLVDTDVAGRHVGHVAANEHTIVELAAGAPGAVLLVLHHPPMASPIPYFWPRGVPTAEARRLLRRARRVNPRLMVTAGHTHRHRRRELAGVTVTEVGSVKDFPGTWAGYVVHEGGIRQVVRRVAAPDVLAWTDRSAGAALGAWGHWSKGTLADRCFSLPWAPPSDARGAPS